MTADLPTREGRAAAAVLVVALLPYLVRASEPEALSVMRDAS